MFIYKINQGLSVSEQIAQNDPTIVFKKHNF